MNEIVNEIGSVVSSGTWVAFAAFGTYLAYKLSMTTIITVGIIKIFRQIFSIISDSKSVNQKLYQLVAQAGMRWPLSDDEWKELQSRVRK